MTTLELASLVLSAEFALASAIILFVVRRRQQQAAATEQQQAKGLKTVVQGEAPSRREALTKLFKSNAHLKGRQLTTTVDQFLSREQAFYDAMLNIYLNKDGKSLKDIPEELRKVLTPWAELQAGMNEDTAAIGDLRAENAQLSAQLEHNKEVIERLLEEYDASFKRFQDTGQQQEPEPQQKEDAPAEDEEDSLENQIHDILSSDVAEDDETLDALDAFEPSEPVMPDSSPAEAAPPEEEELIFQQNEDQEELADLFDSVDDVDKPSS